MKTLHAGEPPARRAGAAAATRRPLSASRAMWLLPFQPREFGLRANDVTLARAYTVHFLVLAIIPFAGLLAGAAIDVTINFARWGHSDWDIMALCVGAWRELMDLASSAEFRLGAVVVFLTIEIAFLLSAVLLLPWAARPEPLRRTFARNLRIVWLDTAQWIYVILAVALGFGLWAIFCIYQRFDHPEYFDPQYGYVIYKVTPTVWLLRNGEFVAGWAAVLACAWILLTWLRAASAPVEPSTPPPPPTCEMCGYNLTSTPAAGRCPECGTRVSQSLAPDVRSGFPWERAPGTPFLRTCFQITVSSIADPLAVFKHVPVRSGQGRAFRFLLYTLSLGAFFGYPALVALYWSESGEFPGLARDGVYFLFAYPAMWALGWAIASGVGALVGVYRTWADGKNQMPAAAKAAMYTGGLLLLWGAGTVLLFSLLLRYRSALRSISGQWSGNDDALTMLIIIGLSLTCLGLYVAFVNRAARAMRYANC